MACWCAVSHAAVHPRGCGEYFAPAPGAANGLWFIPADAGNTQAPAHPARRASVHPRGCGEYAKLAARARAQGGSSPRMRGIRCGRVTSHASLRFIPADAGNTRPAPIRGMRMPVHPRGCGEYGHIARQPARRVGSSPRMRGIQQGRCAGVVIRRFIPADAGNTAGFWVGLRWMPVHPRGCGEYMFSWCLPSVITGSSPRMRGIRGPNRNDLLARRFIPADAGNTL